MARQHVAAFGFFLLLSVAMTWPLARNLDRAVAWCGDSYINTWILDWDWYATFHQPLSLFQANAFYPARDSLAFSENVYGIALFLLPFRAAGLSPITAHNLAILGGFALSGFGAYLLGRYVSGGALAGIVAGTFYAFVPFRFTHLTHVQHVWGGTLPLLLLSLLWYAERPTWPRALIFAAVFLFNGLCNIHWLLFGTIAIAAMAVVLRPRLFPLITCTTVAGVLIAAFLHPYSIVANTYGMERSWSETMAFSALPADWLAVSRYSRFYTALHEANVDPERWLFPGALSLVIAAVGLASADRKSVKLAAIWIAIGVFGSLGLHMVFHRFLFSHVPGFRAIRVPARWAAIAYVGLAMLVAIGSAMIARRRKWVYALLAIAFILELRAAPIRWFMAPTEARPIDLWLQLYKPNAIVELPIRADTEYEVMLRSTAHHRPMVNGISGFAPPEYERVTALAHVWSDQLVSELRRIGVSHGIVHADRLDNTGRAWLTRALAGRQLAFVRRFDGGVQGDWLFTVGGIQRPSPELDAMLRGLPTRNENTFGAFESPPMWTQITNRTVISGFAFSPNGIREVNLLLNNGGVRLKTELRTDAQLQQQFPWYPATAKPRFFAQFPSRPAGVWKETDIQPEIIDGNGQRILLDDRWVEWP